MNFDDAFTRLIGFEGSYVNDPNDPGGETKFGISKRSYPTEDIAAMTLDRAKAIYFRDYWGPAGCDALPEGMKADVFDMAVNSGVGLAVKSLQKAVGEKVDGVFGAHTLQAVQSMKPEKLLARFNGHRLLLLTDLPTWASYGRGWTKRVARILTEA